ARRGLTVLPEAGAGDEAASPHHDRPEGHPLHPDWRWQLRHRISTLDEIERLLPLTSEERAAMVSAPSHFRVGITPYYFSLIDRDHPACPVRMQVIPRAGELVIEP